MRDPPPFISTEADVDETYEAIKEAQNAPKATKLKILVSSIAICSIMFGLTIFVMAKLADNYLSVGDPSKALNIGLYGGVLMVLLLVRYYIWPALARALWF